MCGVHFSKSVPGGMLAFLPILICLAHYHRVLAAIVSTEPVFQTQTQTQTSRLRNKLFAQTTIFFSREVMQFLNSGPFFKN
jgi:hypothetical protein